MNLNSAMIRVGDLVSDTLPRDFTYEMYEALIEKTTECAYSTLPVKEYISAESLPNRFAVFRHDVDRKPQNALDIARIEAEHGVTATYYFRTVDKTFNPELIQTIASLGHEIGYHYEDLDRADGDIDRAHELFAENLEQLRAVCDIDTVCMHGNPLTPHDNRDIWTEEYDFDEYGLLGEAYLSANFTDLTYFSDTGRTWRDGTLKVKDTTTGPSEKQYQASGTEELIQLVKSGRLQRPYILSHPNRWAGSYDELVYVTGKDTVINVGKRALQMFR